MQAKESKALHVKLARDAHDKLDELWHELRLPNRTAAVEACIRFTHAHRPTREDLAILTGPAEGGRE